MLLVCVPLLRVSFRRTAVVASCGGVARLKCAYQHLGVGVRGTVECDPRQDSRFVGLGRKVSMSTSSSPYVQVPFDFDEVTLDANSANL